MTRTTDQQSGIQSGEATALARAVLRALHSAWKAVTVYEENNSVYVARRKELLAALEAIFKIRSECEIVYQSDYFFVDGNRLNYDRDFAFGRALALRFKDLKLGGISFNSTTEPSAIDQALVVLAHADTRAADPYAALLESWSGLAIDGISIAPLSPDDSDHLHDEESGEANSRAVRMRRAQALFQRSESVVQEFWERARDRNSFDASATRRVVHQLIDQIANDEETLLEFTTLKDFDEYTYYHCVNVSVYAIAVGLRLGLDRARLTQLGMTALFHDIGKVKLPQDLINKPEEFDENDWRQIRQHPTLGALTLARIRQIDEQIGLAMAGAFEHHLRMDGTGYPAQSQPRELHLFSRIIMLCDVYDAMTAGRVYHKKRTSPDEAMKRILYRAKEWYDPLIVKAFINMLGIFPVGTVARLSDGSVAVVTRNASDDVFAPEVLVIRDPNGAPIRQELRLAKRSKDSGESGLYITEILDAVAEKINIHEYLAVVEPQRPITDPVAMT